MGEVKQAPRYVPSGGNLLDEAGRKRVVSAQPEDNKDIDAETRANEVRRGIPALSVQATAIIRAIDALGALSWWSIAGMALSLLFAGLMHLQRDITLDYVYIGEYQIPTEFLPHWGVAFGIFIQWMLVTRVLHICRVFESTTLRVDTIRDMVRLNPPMINLLEQSGNGRVSTGFGVFVAIWAVFYGNLVGLMIFLMVARFTSLGVTDLTGTLMFLALLGINIYFGLRYLGPALGRLHELLYSQPLKFGVYRGLVGALLFIVTIGYHFDPLVSDMTEQENGLLGPVIANAVDGDTLFVNGWEVDLLGVDALEPDQTCLLASGERIDCGAEATAHLQSLVEDTPVLCWPWVSTGERSIAASCLLDEGQGLPEDDRAGFFTPEQQAHSLARRLVRDGYAIPMSVGPEEFKKDLLMAQSERRGAWRASVQPPWTVRVEGE